jgi:exonuclease SbcD
MAPAMKFVHAADLHLDSPLRGLSRYDGSRVESIRGATRRALENLVTLCLEEGAAFLILAGDLYDGDWKDYSTGLFFASQLARLRAADIPVVLLRGNHDAQSQITRHLRLPDNVVELSVQKPESVDLKAAGVRVHGQGFANKAVTDDLARSYPQATRGVFNIGVLHTSAGGREGHENYAPCQLDTLLSKGYDYWALGHVHQREVLSSEPYIVFPGNLQGRHVREPGPKGATLVHVENDRIRLVEHRPVDVLRWDTVRVDVTGAESGRDVVDLAGQAMALALTRADGLPVAARLMLTGRTRAHAALATCSEQYAHELRLAANDIGQDGIFLEKIVMASQGTLDLAAVREQNDAIGELARSLHRLKNDPAELGKLLPELKDLKQKLPLELLQEDGPLALDEAHLAELIGEVEEMLIPRLLARELGR